MITSKSYYIKLIILSMLIILVSINRASAAMTIGQTLSDEGQRNTISFSALSFISGSLGADSFFPPGKVADFWGFQYLRDNDPSEKGHNTDFLTNAANNMLYILNDEQLTELVTLAESQVDSINQYAYQRFPLMKAFRRLLDGESPTAASGLDLNAIKSYSAQLYRLDGEISLQRAQVMGGILNSLNSEQRAYLDAIKGLGMLEWPEVSEQLDRQAYEHDVHVAIMTYAGDLFSWYLGSIEADVYFAPERQGTYFGSFYMKDAPAMGNSDYTIDSALTGNMGQTVLDLLTTEQAKILIDIVDTQSEALNGIVNVRESVSQQLRKYIEGLTVDNDNVLQLMEYYGELDGEIIYLYAMKFAELNESLSSEQKTDFAQLRVQILGDFDPDGAYLYSNPIEMPEIRNTDFLFGVSSDFCSESNLENVEYNPDNTVLTLNRVKVGELWYYAELQNIGDLVFKINQAHTIPIDNTQKTSACYDESTLMLNIPQVLVGTSIKNVTLNHIGDWLFHINAVTE